MSKQFTEEEVIKIVPGPELSKSAQELEDNPSSGNNSVHFEDDEDGMSDMTKVAIAVLFILFCVGIFMVFRNRQISNDAKKQQAIAKENRIREAARVDAERVEADRLKSEQRKREKVESDKRARDKTELEKRQERDRKAHDLKARGKLEQIKRDDEVRKTHEEDKLADIPKIEETSFEEDEEKEKVETLVADETQEGKKESNTKESDAEAKKKKFESQKKIAYGMIIVGGILLIAYLICGVSGGCGRGSCYKQWQKNWNIAAKSVNKYSATTGQHAAKAPGEMDFFFCYDKCDLTVMGLSVVLVVAGIVFFWSAKQELNK